MQSSGRDHGFRPAASRPAQHRERFGCGGRRAYLTGFPGKTSGMRSQESRPEKKRGEVVRFKEGFDVIDDSYNSNPKALTEMIRFLGKLQGYKTEDRRRRRDARAGLHSGRTPSIVRAGGGNGGRRTDRRSPGRSAVCSRRSPRSRRRRVAASVRCQIPWRPARLWPVPSEAEMWYWSRVRVE